MAKRIVIEAERDGSRTCPCGVILTVKGRESGPVTCPRCGRTVAP